MEKQSEPYFKKSSCSYCGDAQVSHALFYFDSLISSVLEPHILSVSRRAPGFLKELADWLPIFTFKTFALLRLAHFSEDISKAKTFRSKVAWEEALRRGIRMEQLILWGKPMEYYRAFLPEKNKGGEQTKEIFFQSLPIPPKHLELTADWDNKFILKEEFQKHNIPVPSYFPLPLFSGEDLPRIFEQMDKPIIVKPKLGSRGRHTVTDIRTLAQMEDAVKIGRALSPYLIVEEHLHGYVCRATLVGGKLAGFYRGEAPAVTGDGEKTVRELIEEKDKHRHERVEPITIGEELESHIGRQGFGLDDVPERGFKLSLSHRVGRLFGGATREMLDELDPSFVPIFEKAVRITGLAVAGFDCIVPDPTKPAHSQKWGIIECNTLPYIDLHYYALEGKPKNIAGMVWDLWEEKLPNGQQ
jgi:D-alanine-D-alanine ligase-like ATP-grasp enzyme